MNISIKKIKLIKDGYLFSLENKSKIVFQYYKIN